MNERRSKILHAAEELLDEGGVTGLTMRALGERIGFTPPVIYSHFDGKDAVIGAVADAALSVVTRIVAEVGQTPGEDLFIRIATAVFDYAVDHRGAMEAISATKGGDDGQGELELRAELATAMRTVDPTIDDETMGLRAAVGWATIEGIALQVDRGFIPRTLGSAMISEAFAAYTKAWIA